MIIPIGMTPEVEKAAQEIKDLFSDKKIDVAEVSDGGACVIVHDIELSATYSPQLTWIGFIIGFQYPRVDVYPHFIEPSIKRVDQAALGEGFSGPTEWQKRSCIQVSRKSNRLDPSIDTAATKLIKVIEWINSK